jgi:hypothetical protein
MKPLPDTFLRCLAPESKKVVGQKTLAEAEDVAGQKSEKAMQDTFWNFCCLKGITTDSSAMNKKTTRRVGMADFPCYYRGRVLFLEFKRKGGKLSRAQEEFRDEIERQGFPYCVAYSASQGIEFAIKYLLSNAK